MRWDILEEGCHLMLVWLLASRADNRLPADDAWLAVKTCCKNFKLQPLVDAGFVEMLAECKQDASTLHQKGASETETETERETETEAEGEGPGEGDTLSRQTDSGLNVEKAVCIIPLLAGGAFNVTASMVEAWGKAFPAVDITAAVRRAREWCLANPTKLKRNGRRFVTGWLAREQERGGCDRGSSPPPMHLTGRAAALAAQAADAAGLQGRFWQMHDLMFADQKKLEIADLGPDLHKLRLPDQTGIVRNPPLERHVARDPQRRVERARVEI